MNRIKINGIDLSYRDRGAGIPVVFLHAFPLNQTMWDEQIDFLSSKFRVVTLDWRGFGESTPGSGETTLDSMAGDLAGLLDHLSIEKAVICGLSMGGYAAFAFFRKHPDRIRGLILADTRATADSEDGKRGRFEMAATVRSKGPAALVETMTRRLIGQTSFNENPAVVERVGRMIMSNNSEGIAQALVAMAARPDSSDLLARIDCPTLVICGEEDTLTPPEEARMISRAIAGSILELIPRAGHLPNVEQPDVFNRVVLKFLESQSPQ
jgi:pimeloyl-ACP methyl ester carboxylesterase